MKSLTSDINMCKCIWNYPTNIEYSGEILNFEAEIKGRAEERHAIDKRFKASLF